MLLNLMNEQIDEMLDEVLLFRESIGRKAVAEIFAHRCMGARVGLRQQIVHLTGHRLVKRSLQELLPARYVPVDLFPARCTTEAELVRSNSHEWTVAVVELFD